MINSQLNPLQIQSKDDASFAHLLIIFHHSKLLFSVQIQMNEITCNNNNTIEMSRNQLIMWINSILKVNISKIQQLGSGSLYCQLLDILHPNKVPLNKINWKAKHDYEYVNNFKILQQCFNKFGIMKNIPVQKLIRCKYQDNLQFLQWFKKTFDTIQPNREYDPIQRRSNEIQLPPLIPSERINRKDSSILNKTREKFSIQRQRSITKIQSNTKNNDYRMDIQNSFIDKLIEDNLISEKNGYSRQIQKAKSERDFFFNKLRDIDHVLDQFKYKLITRGPIQQLKQQIYKILLCPPQESIHFNSDGYVSKRFKQQTPVKSCLEGNDSKNISFTKNEQKLSLEKNEQIKQQNQKVDCKEFNQQKCICILQKQSQEIKEQKNIMMKQSNSQQKKLIQQ